jgi:hypothetical protein
MPSSCFTKLTIFVAMGGFLQTLPALAEAEELKPGFSIDKNNLQEVSEKTFEGKKVGDMLPDAVRDLINLGLTIPNVQSSKELAVDPQWKKLSDESKAEVDASTHELKNYVSGQPFTKIETSDPLGGYKAIYNWFRSPALGDSLEYDPMVFLAINGKSGVERELRARVTKFLYQGRLHEPHTLDAEKVLVSQLVIIYPNDARGVGLLTPFYQDGRMPDIYAYIKPVRRVRRLSGGGWADPMSGMDILNDEITGYNADPRWYEDVKLTGKQTMLAIAHSENPGPNLIENDLKKRYGLNVTQPPYWNFDDVYEPRPVWVGDIKPKSTHLGSRKTYYIDADPYYSYPYVFKTYDRSGKPWKVMLQGMATFQRTDSTIGIRPSALMMVDLQRFHGTVSPASNKNIYRANINNDPNAYSPNSLSRLLQ